MSRIEKLLQKFQKKPESVRYTDVETILMHVGCEKIGARGSHVKFKHRKLRHDIVIPVHKNECKPLYKKQALKQITKLLHQS
jgi:predicted RNA binding protein YcfA (HicA-like mRNA interferase family)